MPCLSRAIDPKLPAVRLNLSRAQEYVWVCSSTRPRPGRGASWSVSTSTRSSRATLPASPGSRRSCGAKDPEDVVQEAFVRLFAARARIREPEVVPYLNRIVVNEVRSRARRAQTAARKRHLLGQPETSPGPDGDPQSVVHELGRLPRRQREALVLRYWLDLPFDEVADVMGVRPGTAKSQVSRGLSALAIALGEEKLG
jgi:RNA polymerase sigma factor (sigma-70 family)